MRRHASASLMSNTKWRALFQAVWEAKVEIRQIIVKFMDVNDPKTIRGVSIQAPFPFVDTIEFGPVSLVSIEWLEFPKVAIFPRAHRAAVTFQQDIGKVRAAIEATGKRYPLEEHASGLRVIGHAL